MESSIAGSMAIVHNRVLGHLSDGNALGRCAPEKLVAPEAAQEAQSPAPVDPADDVVTVDPFAQAYAELQAIIERLGEASSGEGARDALSDLQGFISEHSDAQFAGGVLSEIGGLVDDVLSTLEADPEAFGDFVSFNFNFQFSQKSLTTDRSSLEATSFSFSFDFVSENTSFSARLNFDEKIMQSPGAFQSMTSESADISLVTMNMDMDSNPALEGFIDITNRLLGAASPFAGIAGQDAQVAPPPVADAENSPVPVPPATLRSQLFGLEENSDVRQRALELLNALFERLSEKRHEALAPAAAA